MSTGTPVRTNGTTVPVQQTVAMRIPVPVQQTVAMGTLVQTAGTPVQINKTKPPRKTKTNRTGVLSEQSSDQALRQVLFDLKNEVGQSRSEMALLKQQNSLASIGNFNQTTSSTPPFIPTTSESVNNNSFFQGRRHAAQTPQNNENPTIATNATEDVEYRENPENPLRTLGHMAFKHEPMDEENDCPAKRPKN
jgi:hypothetical protein